MPADSVIEYFDPFENVLPGLFAGPIALMMHVFRFQRMEEAFHHGIVPAVPAPTHTRRQAVLGEQFAVRGGGVLGSSVRMMPHAVRRCRCSTAMVSAAVATSCVRRLPSPRQ